MLTKNKHLGSVGANKNKSNFLIGHFKNKNGPETNFWNRLTGKVPQKW